MNQQLPKEVMDSISNEVKVYGNKYTTGSMLAMGIHGYSLAAEELARYQAELMEVRSSLTTQKELKTILNLLIDYRNSLIASNKPVGNINLIIKHLQTKYIEAEALSSLPGKQDGEIEGQDELWSELANYYQKWIDDDFDERSAEEVATDELKSKYIIHLKTK